ncbi:MAG: GNAT family N-acetyltransferase [Anaerolineae bacterium]|nr:GNAT family N-acetyltransferase [Anaerolineae bacterium]
MQRPLSLTVRPAVAGDQEAIQLLLASTFSPFGQAWPWREYLGRDVFWVACCDGQLVGALLAWPDAGPVAWVRLAILAPGIGTGSWLDLTLPALSSPLRRCKARVLAWLDVGGWAGPALEGRGFRSSTQLLPLVKESRWLPSVGGAEAALRPVEREDLALLARIDRAAFSPPWWLSETTLDRLRQESVYFSLAEWAGRCAGYATAQLTAHGAHIGRLVVLPAAQGHGIGALLLRDLLDHLYAFGIAHVTLNTQQDNRASRRLYARFGFYPLGRRVAVWERQI